jgi:hypothetical protein
MPVEYEYEGICKGGYQDGRIWVHDRPNLKVPHGIIKATERYPDDYDVPLILPYDEYVFEHAQDEYGNNLINCFPETSQYLGVWKIRAR